MPEPNYCAVLTPIGRGAVATIRVRGPGCQELVQRFFRNRFRQGSLPLNQIVVGRWSSPRPATAAASAVPTDEASLAGEEVVVARTAEDTIDVHCHGGRAAVEAIIDVLSAGGCQVVSGVELSERPTAGEIRQEALVALGKATTETVAGHVLAQYQGALQHGLDRCVALLQDNDVTEASSQVQRLVESAKLGIHLTTPFRVAFCGPPNVGKSSLVNALVGFERSIVFDQAGTTRDVLTVSTAIGGWPFELLDTAGLRHGNPQTADGRIESAGIEMAIEQADEADLVVFVSAWDQPWTAEMDRWLTRFPKTLLVHNKSDLSDFSSLGKAPADRPPGINTSLVPKAEIGPVLEAIGKRLIGIAPPVGSPLLFTERQLKLVNDALQALRKNNVPAALEVLLELR